MKNMGKTNISIIAIMFFSYYNFSSCKQPEIETIRRINVSSSIPLINRDGSIVENKDYFNVYYYRDLIMFEFRNPYDSISNDSLIMSEFRNNFFVYKKQTRYGFTYDRHNIRNHNKKLLVDSLLERRAFQNFKWHVVIDTPVFKVAASDFDAKAGILQEIYISPGGNRMMENDSIFFYYDNKLKDIDFSLSKVLDSLKSMKLYKIRLLHASSCSEEHEMTFPKRETRIELKEMPVQNHKGILYYFEWYEKIIKEDSSQN